MEADAYRSAVDDEASGPFGQPAIGSRHEAQQAEIIGLCVSKNNGVKDCREVAKIHALAVIRAEND